MSTTTVGTTPYLTRVQQRFVDCHGRLSSDLGRPPTIREIAGDMGKSCDCVRYYADSTRRRGVSLDLCPDRAGRPKGHVPKQLTEVARTLIAKCESMAVELGRPPTIQEVARALGKSRQCVTDIVRRLRKRGVATAVRHASRDRSDRIVTPNDVRPLPIPPTSKQTEVFDMIVAYQRFNGYPPTVRDIGKKMGIKSPNGVMCHLRALAKKGLISREPDKSRGIHVFAGEPCPHCGGLGRLIDEPPVQEWSGVG